MSGAPEKIIAVITEVTIYPSSETRNLLFCIPALALAALELPNGDVGLYVVVRDVFGNLIHQRRVELTSGPEVRKSDFERQVSTGQLYPGQRIRLDVSLP